MDNHHTRKNMIPPPQRLCLLIHLYEDCYTPMMFTVSWNDGSQEQVILWSGQCRNVSRNLCHVVHLSVRREDHVCLYDGPPLAHEQVLVTVEKHKIVRMMHF